MKKGKPDRERIVGLLRSNAALLLLCFIAICLLVIFLRGPSAPVGTGYPPVSAPVMAGTPSADVPDNLAQSPLRNMPPPAAFKSFVYEKGSVATTSGVCEDAYRVALIYSSVVDYRLDPLSAKYNTATACIKGETYSDSIALDPLGLDEGESYYLIAASQGKTGIWYDPH